MHSVVERLKTMSLEAKIDDSVSQSAQVNLSLVEFADDVTGVTVCDNEHQVQKSLEIMAQEYKKYFAANGLKINVLKSEHIVFGYPRTCTIYDDGRKEADTVKLLGLLTVSKNYKFELGYSVVIALY